jgi:hypothetical protein
MALHILKLCVGWDSVDDLDDRIAERREVSRAMGEADEMAVQTRMMPTRKAEILDGGSLYWVIKSKIQARQIVTDIRQFVDSSGVKRCWIVVKPELIRTSPRPRKPFQGWRYGTADDVPKDLHEGDREMPEEMRKELVRLGLL